MGDDSVDEEDVRHIASIARINVDEDEVQDFVPQFQKILDRFEKLESVSDEAELNESLRNVARRDEIRDSLSADEALSNTEETDDDYFRGPPVS